MNIPICRTSILIHATPEEVWDAVTKPELVKQYFYGADLETTWEVGSPIVFKGEWEGVAYEDKGVIQSFVPGRSLSYTYKPGSDTSLDVPENYQLVTYQVDPRDVGVELSIAQTADTEEKASHSEKNWCSVLDSIKTLLEAK